MANNDSLNISEQNERIIKSVLFSPYREILSYGVKNANEYLVKSLREDTRTGEQKVVVERVDLGKAGLEGLEVKFDKEGKPHVSTDDKDLDPRQRLKNLKEMTELQFKLITPQDMQELVDIRKSMANEWYNVDPRKLADNQHGIVYRYFDQYFTSCEDMLRSCTNVVGFSRIAKEEQENRVNDFIYKENKKGSLGAITSLKLGVLKNRIGAFLSKAEPSDLGVKNVKTLDATINDLIKKKVNYIRNSKEPGKILSDFAMAVDNDIIKRQENQKTEEIGMKRV